MEVWGEEKISLKVAEKHWAGCRDKKELGRPKGGFPGALREGDARLVSSTDVAHEISSTIHYVTPKCWQPSGALCIWILLDSYDPPKQITVKKAESVKLRAMSRITRLQSVLGLGCEPTSKLVLAS